jgi:hypothetical protein
MWAAIVQRLMVALLPQKRCSRPLTQQAELSVLIKMNSDFGKMVNLAGT